jgi:hypothetical protein
MNKSCRVSRLAASCLIVLVTLELDSTAQAQQPLPGTVAPSNQAQSAGQAENRESSSASPDPAIPDAPTAQNAPAESSQNPAQQPSGQESTPLGTAAAPYTRPTGVTGSRPAGAVIAPAKQRRVRAILISVGVIAAAAIAVGTVAALSHGSPSHPIGAN